MKRVLMTALIAIFLLMVSSTLGQGPATTPGTKPGSGLDRNDKQPQVPTESLEEPLKGINELKIPLDMMVTPSILGCCEVAYYELPDIPVWHCRISKYCASRITKRVNRTYACNTDYFLRCVDVKLIMNYKDVVIDPTDSNFYSIIYSLFKEEINSDPSLEEVCFMTIYPHTYTTTQCYAKLLEAIELCQCQ